jgi:hypothetical protein
MVFTNKVGGTPELVIKGSKLSSHPILCVEIVLEFLSPLIRLLQSGDRNSNTISYEIFGYDT